MMRNLHSSPALLVAVIMALFMLVTPSDALAAICTANGVQGGSFDAAFSPPPAGTGSGGYVSGVAQEISSILGGMASDMFHKLTSELHGLISAVTALYIFCYGCLFMFGAVSTTVWDFLVRVVKLGIVLSLLQGGHHVYNLMYSVFECGTDEMINKVITIMTGETSSGSCTTSPPLEAVDKLAAMVFSSKMAVTLWATLKAGIYGPVMFVLLGLSLNSILMSILQAMWVYMMSKIVRTLLFGVAPIFISCLLFQRTRYMFDGWVNQLVNTSLQPIFLFAFFTFFVSLMTMAVTKILETPVCVTEVTGSIYAAPASLEGWRHAVKDGSGYTIYSGSWGPKGAEGVAGQPMFPIPVVTIIVFFVIAELAGRFNSVVLAVAAGIAHSSINFSQIEGVFTRSGLPGFLQPSSSSGSPPPRTGPPTPPNIGGRPSAGGEMGGPSGQAAAAKPKPQSNGRTARDIMDLLRKPQARPGAKLDDK